MNISNNNTDINYEDFFLFFDYFFYILTVFSFICIFFSCIKGSCSFSINVNSENETEEK